LILKVGTRQPLGSKVDNVRVRAGDRVIFRTAGGGGWGEPIERDAMRVRNDVARKLLTADRARQDYGVVLSGPQFELDHRATDELRESMRRKRKLRKLFDFGARRASGGTRADI
jgi:N-methylhydantoinase B